MHAHTQQLDLRTVAPADRQAKTFAAFDLLAPGQVLVLVADKAPRELLHAFEATRPGAYNWSPLEGGPERWRVRVDRRALDHGRSRGANEYLSWDHDRLDERLEGVQADVRAGNWHAAQLGLSEFSVGLLRHIQLEEELLFPAFERLAGMPRDQGPTAVMREEHAEIRDALGTLCEAVGRAARGELEGARTRFEHGVKALLDVLGEHNLKEEQVLYPTVDSLLGEADRDTLVRRMMAVMP